MKLLMDGWMVRFGWVCYGPRPKGCLVVETLKEMGGWMDGCRGSWRGVGRIQISKLDREFVVLVGGGPISIKLHWPRRNNNNMALALFS